MFPSERLLVPNLDQGFGWNEICGFLNRKTPNTPYPLVWTMSEFLEAVGKRIAREIRKNNACSWGRLASLCHMIFRNSQIN